MRAEVELGDMTKEAAPKRAWTRPELTRLGEIKDVSGPHGIGLQAGGGGQNRS